MNKYIVLFASLSYGCAVGSIGTIEANDVVDASSSNEDQEQSYQAASDAGIMPDVSSPKAFRFNSESCVLKIQDVTAAWCGKQVPVCDPLYTAGYEYCFDQTAQGLFGSCAECLDEALTVLCCVTEYAVQTGGCDYTWCDESMRKWNECKEANKACQ